MPFLDTLQDAVARVLPEKKPTLPMPTSTTGGIGNTGMMPFEDDMIVSKPAIIFHASQSFFNFLAMCCFASVAAFQSKWNVGPSGLTGFALFISVTGIIFPLFLLFVPVVYDKYNKGARLARALGEIRVGFILSGAGSVISLLISFIVTISAWTEPGCKNPDNDPHASLGDSFKDGLSGWCATKKAGAVFFWFVFGFWVASFVLIVMDWRNGKSTRPRDAPFMHPEFSEVASHEAEDFGDEESQYNAKPVDNSDDAQSPFVDTPYTAPSFPAAPATSYTSPAQPRPSIDAYGAFSDPPPSGFGATRTETPSDDGARVSRTMQYADPYAAVRATVAAGQRNPVAPSNPPGYSSYSGY